MYYKTTKQQNKNKYLKMYFNEIRTLNWTYETIPIVNIYYYVQYSTNIVFLSNILDKYSLTSIGTTSTFDLGGRGAGYIKGNQASHTSYQSTFILSYLI